MSKTKTWIGDIQKIRKKLLEMSPTQPLGRADIQNLFGLQKSAACDLMKVIGRPPEFARIDAWVVEASAVLEYLRLSGAGQEADRIEAERRDRLAKKLRAEAEDQELRSHPIEASSADQWARLRDLPIFFSAFDSANHPANLGLRKMTIVFSGKVDLITTLYRFGKAISGSDGDELDRMIEKL